MAAPLWPLPPEQWALPQEERWRLWEDMTGKKRPTIGIRLEADGPLLMIDIKDVEDGDHLITHT